MADDKSVARWRYGPSGEKRLIPAGEETPSGWSDTPATFGNRDVPDTSHLERGGRPPRYDPQGIGNDERRKYVRRTGDVIPPDLATQETAAEFRARQPSSADASEANAQPGPNSPKERTAQAVKSRAEVDDMTREELEDYIRGQGHGVSSEESLEELRNRAKGIAGDKKGASAAVSKEHALSPTEIDTTSRKKLEAFLRSQNEEVQPNESLTSLRSRAKDLVSGGVSTTGVTV